MPGRRLTTSGLGVPANPAATLPASCSRRQEVPPLTNRASAPTPSWIVAYPSNRTVKPYSATPSNVARSSTTAKSRLTSAAADRPFPAAALRPRSNRLSVIPPPVRMPVGYRPPAQGSKRMRARQILTFQRQPRASTPRPDLAVGQAIGVQQQAGPVAGIGSEWIAGRRRSNPGPKRRGGLVSSVADVGGGTAWQHTHAGLCHAVFERYFGTGMIPHP